MILIFGGAYQGKLDYALKNFNLTKNDVYNCSDDDINTPQGKKIIYEIDKWILALVKNNLDAGTNLKKFMDENENPVVICNDISSGVVPVDPVLRKWREAVGRAMAVISQNSTGVIRLYCGIPAKIK